MATIEEKRKAAKIIGIQFSILSPEEIRNGSVAEIVNRDTYINNKPIIGGLFDPRMGVLDPGLVCPTDGLDYMNTPGYFGHMELARPVFYIQYFSTVLKIVRCVCIKCSKLLLNKKNFKHLAIGLTIVWAVAFGTLAITGIELGMNFRNEEEIEYEYIVENDSTDVLFVSVMNDNIFSDHIEYDNVWNFTELIKVQNEKIFLGYPELRIIEKEDSSNFEIKKRKAEKFVLKLVSCLIMARQIGSVSSGNWLFA